MEGKLQLPTCPICVNAMQSDWMIPRSQYCLVENFKVKQMAAGNKIMQNEPMYTVKIALV